MQSSSSVRPAAQGHPPGRWRRLQVRLRLHWGALLVGALFMATCVYYNVAIPLWESDYEWSHYAYARYLVTNGRLPDPMRSSVPFTSVEDQCDQEDATARWNHQFRQPPLYYLLGALAISPIKVEQELPVMFNPHLFAKNASGGYNVVVHTPAESFPYQGSALAVHVLRLLSSLIGLGGLVATYLSGLVIFSQQRFLATAMMSVNAFIPQYVFSSSVVNNDILAGALASWCVFLCLYAVLRKAGPLVLMLAAAAAGFAVIAKYTALPLIPLVGVTALVRLLQARQDDRTGSPGLLWRIGLVIALASLPIVLWFGRNMLLFGSFFGQYAEVVESTPEDPSQFLIWSGGESLVDPVRAAEFAFVTFWGLFGNDTIALPPPLVALLAAACLLALVGLIIFVLDKQQPRHVRILVLAAFLFVLETWAMSAVKAVGTSEPRGRYLLPIFSTVSFLLVVGIHRLLPARLRKAGLATFCSALLALTLAIPIFVLRPAYAPPTIEDSAELLPGEVAVHAIFGDFAELIGYRVAPSRLGLFEKVQVTLVWRALKDTPNNYTMSLHLMDGENRSHGSLATFPGHGNFATSLWEPGTVFRDTYDLYLGPSARGYLPSLGRVKLALHCFGPQETRHLDVSDPAGNLVGDAISLGRLKLVPEQELAATSVPSPALLVFGDELALQSYSTAPPQQLPGGSVRMTFTWQTLRPPSVDYSLFVHLKDRDGNQVAGSDQLLSGPHYPSGLWDAGEMITHVHQLDLPMTLAPGQYGLYIGLYDLDTGERVPVRDYNGVEQSNGEARLGVIEVLM